jgi:hypothetical protein
MGAAAAACLLLAAVMVPLWLRQPRRQYLLLWPRQSNRPSGVPCTGAAGMGTLCLLLEHEPGQPNRLIGKCNI